MNTSPKFALNVALRLFSCLGFRAYGLGSSLQLSQRSRGPAHGGRGILLLMLLAVCLAPAHVKSQPVLALRTGGVAQGHAAGLPLWLLNSSNLTGLQIEFGFDPLSMTSNSLAVVPVAPGLFADGALAPSNRFRVVLVATNRLPLPNGLLASLTIVALSNSPNGGFDVPLVNLPDNPVVGATTNGLGVSQVSLKNGCLLVGDAFGFTDAGGQVQFRAIEGASYRFQSSTNLVGWSDLGDKTGTDELVIWIDSTATNFTQRFYRVQGQ